MTSWLLPRCFPHFKDETTEAEREKHETCTLFVKGYVSMPTGTNLRLSP